MIPTHSTIAVTLITLSSLPAVLSQTCRWKNGMEANDYFVCDPTASQSSCCLQGEACVANGLCYGSLGQIYRGACAGGWGNSTACPDQCVDKGNDAGWSNLFLCPSVSAPSGAQSWWCGDTSALEPCDVDGTASHSSKAYFFSLPIFGMLPSAIMPWSSKNFTGCAVSQSNSYSLTKQAASLTENTSSNSTCQNSNTGNTGNSSSNNSNSNNNTTCSCPNSSTESSTSTTSAEKDCPNGAQIGEAVAIGVLALLLIATTGWAFWERKQKNRLMAPAATTVPYSDKQHPYTPQYPYGASPQYTPGTPATRISEMPTYKGPSMHEMHG